MIYLSGKEGGTRAGTAVTERAARAAIYRDALARQTQLRAQASPFPPPWSSPFGMPGMMGMGGLPIGGFGSMGGFPMGGQPVRRADGWGDVHGVSEVHRGEEPGAR